MFKQLFKVPLIRHSIVSAYVSKTPEKLTKTSLLPHLLKTENQVIFKRTVSRSRSATKVSRGPVTWASLTVFLLAGGACYAYVRQIKAEKEEAARKERKKSVGKASLGGPFELIDVDGNEVTDKSLLGKWALIYFGFCHCPDICPDQLEKITECVNRVNAFKELPNVLPVYITVDPSRDTKEIIKEYIKDFHPDMVGLTGTDEQVKKVCKAYRVYFSAGPRDDDDDYIVDHTVIMYLIDPDGNFSEYFGQNKSINEIVNGISAKMLTF